MIVVGGVLCLQNIGGQSDLPELCFPYAYPITASGCLMLAPGSVALVSNVVHLPSL